MITGDHRFLNWFEGIPKAGQKAIADEVGNLHEAIRLLKDDTPSNDKAALAMMKASAEKLHIAPQFRPASSPVRWAIDIVQSASYVGALGYAAHTPAKDWVSQTAVWLFSAAYVADGVRLLGIRTADLGRIWLVDEGRFRPSLGTRLPIFRRPEGQTKVAGSFLFDKGLSIIDETATWFGAAGLLVKVGIEWNKEWGLFVIKDAAGKVVGHSWRNQLPPPGGKTTFDKGWLISGTVAKTFYWGVTTYQFTDSLKRRFVSPEATDADPRNRFLNGKVWAAIGSVGQDAHVRRLPHARLQLEQRSAGCSSMQLLDDTLLVSLLAMVCSGIDVAHGVAEEHCDVARRCGDCLGLPDAMEWRRQLIERAAGVFGAGGA